MMFPSTTASRFLRLGLLSVFCAGLFLSIGEVRVGSTGNISAEKGGVYAVAVAAATETTPAPAGADTKTDKKEPVDDTINSIISFFNLGIGVLTFLITPLIMLAGWLLSPDWTFGEIFWLRPILHQLWVLVSNVVYVIFGFFLVVIAFANIFGWESAKAYEMKTMLPKLVTGMLMVPFTWFIVSAVLSVSNVLTASVIQLPISTILKSDGNTNKLLTNKIIPKNITYDKNGTSAKSANSDFTASECPDECLSIEEFLTNGKWGAYNLLSVYAYGIFKIQGYKSITLEQNVNKIIDVASKLWFWAIFFIVFGILVIAIVYALFSRAVMLWLYAMFSPLFALNYVMDFKGSLKDSVGKLSVTKFLSLAMVPVYVSAALAFWLMFLGLVMGATGQRAGDSWVLESNNVKIETKVEDKSNMTTFQFWEMTFVTKGLLDPKNKAWASTALDIGKGVIGTIIMNILALAILWMAVMAALGADDVTKAAVDPIQKFGGSVWDIMMKAPQYIPIPLWGGKKTSLSGLPTIASNMTQTVQSMWSGDSSTIGQSFGKSLGKIMWLHTNEVTDAIGKLNSSYDSKRPSAINEPRQKGALMREVIGSMGVTAEKAIGDSQLRNALLDKIADAYDLKKEELDSLRNLSNVDQFNAAFKTVAGKEENKKKGLDQLIDKEPWVLDSDKFSGMFGEASSETPPAWSPQKITVTQPSTTTPTQITVNSINATITPKTDTASAKITTQTFKELFDKLKEKDATVTEGDLEAELKKQNIEVSK